MFAAGCKEGPGGDEVAAGFDFEDACEVENVAPAFGFDPKSDGQAVCGAAFVNCYGGAGERLACELLEAPFEAFGWQVGEVFDGGFHVGGMTGSGIGFVFRDAHGIRPSYYYINDEVVVAASERAAIRTAFNVTENQVKELMPGQALIVDEKGIIEKIKCLDSSKKEEIKIRSLY